MENLAEWSWADDVVFACGCGVYFAARRWRWLDAEANPELAEAVRGRGPVVGECPACGRSADAHVDWLELHPAVERARLWLGPQQRAEVIELLRGHLERVGARPNFARGWLLRPEIEFITPAEGEAQQQITRDTAVVPTPVPPEPSGPAWNPPPAADEILWAANGEVDMIDGEVVVRLQVDEATVRVWSEATIEARPINLRDLGYPLLGVRLVGVYLGEKAVIDGFIDVGDVEAHEIFGRLAEQFRLTLVIHGPRGTTALRREVASPGLERNAALCLESASSLLASGDFGPSAYLDALRTLQGLSASERLRPAGVEMHAGDHRTLATAAAAWAALDHLDQASGRDNLTHLLEIDGLPLNEYEAIRRTVLSAAVEFGLTPPSRFWRRILVPEVGPDAAAIVARLAKTRASGRGGELSPEATVENWFRMRDLADRKRVAHPPELRQALADDRGPKRPLGRRRSQQPPMVASGEIGDSSPASSSPVPPAPPRSPNRLAKATEILEGVPTMDQLASVIKSMEDFDADEILALLPALSELGPSVTPMMIERLRSPRREVRQSAVILLGLARDGRAIDPLCDALLAEETNVWRDIARALGNLGPRVIGPLCEVVRRVDPQRRDTMANRVARALAEVVLSDGDARGGPGRHAVEALVDVQDPAIASAATHALATLTDVSSAGEEIRGERPLAEDTAVRGFARRAYEAITTPELDILIEDDLEVEEVG
ncbi:MAG: HEAT repeat domain-containing protein [Myxococcales bacterium]|nr:HEAT repeat domain-containing protein [Myxococcales bacterium]